MAATIDATVGGASANSYVTLAEFNAWLDTRSGTDATTLDAKADDTKNKLLITATERIDQDDYLGLKSDADQALKFPRDGLYDEDGNSVSSITIPARVKRSQYKLALALDSTDLTQQTGLENFEEVTVGPITVKTRSTATTSNVMPDEVRDELKLWRRSSRSQVTVERG